MYARHPWLTPVGLAVIALVVLANAAGPVGFGWSGASLVVTLGVVVYAAAALVFLLWFEARPAANTVLLLVMVAASVAAHHGDPKGTGGIGLYLCMVFAPLRLSPRRAALVGVLSALAFDIHLVLTAANPLVFATVVDAGAALFFVLGLLLRREHEQRLRADALVEELERSREAERASAALAERARVAREVHDVLAHTLSGLVLQLDGTRLTAAALDVDPDVRDAVERAHRLARDGLTEARQAVRAFRGDLVPGPEALPALVRAHREVPGAGRCAYEETGERAALPPEARLALYRTAQEALSNVAKHSPGADVAVRLAWADDAAVLSVRDTGGTAHPVLGQGGAGYGLTGLRERARLLGGDLCAQGDDAGFGVTLTLPLPRRSES